MKQNSETFFENLFSKKSGAIRYDLERIKSAANTLNFNLAKPSFIIAGTNGKGTTSAFVWSLLTSMGLKVGLFTSPHLRSFSERYLISGRELPTPKELKEIFERITKILDSNSPNLTSLLSFFEWSVLIAYEYFSTNNVDFIVWEVGMGGRLDATNIADTWGSIITSIGMDHAEFLGNSIEAITAEKMGVIKPHHYCVFGRSAVQDHFLKSLDFARKNLSPDKVKICAVIGEDFAQGLLDDNPPQKEFSFFMPQYQDQKDFGGMRPIKIKIPQTILESAFFVRNSFGLAVQEILFCAKKFEESFGFNVETKLCECLKLFDAIEPHALPPWPPSVMGRDQKLHIGDVTLTLNVAHNLDGFASIDFEKFSNGVVCISILEDKQCDQMIDMVLKHCPKVFLYSFDHPRSWSRSSLKGKNREIEFYSSLERLWSEQREFFLSLSSLQKNILFCGSVAAIGNLLDFFEVRLHPGFWKSDLYGHDPKKG